MNFMGIKVRHGEAVDVLRAHQLNTAISPFVHDRRIFYPCICGEWAECHAAHQAEKLT